MKVLQSEEENIHFKQESTVTAYLRISAYTVYTFVYQYIYMQPIAFGVSFFQSQISIDDLVL